MRRSHIAAVIIFIFIFMFSLNGCATVENKENAAAGENTGSTRENYLEEDFEVAVLGGGCFWSMEASFSQLKGVRDAEAGYAGGDRENPTYEEVSSKKTGHAEVVKVVFDPDIISYEKLLEVFFYVHDPTTLNRQGNDIGEQYRSIILYTDPVQEDTARDYMEKLEEEGAFTDPIVTQVEPLESYYSAEDYHQEYYENNPDQPYCSVVVGPKVEKFEEKFADLIK
jgi:peptide-methionine (S)-S-oxide reductase